MKAVISDSGSVLKHKLETREARLGIVGMGYVGLPLALLFSGESRVLISLQTR
jgi:UDP-N-acetyl-D-glucosamine dehydrogenase